MSSDEPARLSSDGVDPSPTGTPASGFHTQLNLRLATGAEEQIQGIEHPGHACPLPHLHHSATFLSAKEILVCRSSIEHR